jgi:hypothetical protein
MCVVGRRQYEASTSALSAARNFGAALVIAAVNPSGWRLADDTALVISEFLTAGVRAGATTAEVGVEVHYDQVMITVTDDREPGSDDASEADELGRSVVAALASGQGRSATGRRTTAFARLACDPSFTTQLRCERRPASS